MVLSNYRKIQGLIYIYSYAPASNNDSVKFHCQLLWLSAQSMDD